MANTTSRDNAGHQGGAIRDLVIQFNNLVQTVTNALTGNTGGTGVVIPSTLSIGTTVTLATSTGSIMISGVVSALSALTAQVFGALGTVPADTWALISVERVAAGTETFVSAANNYSTGYATEALAIAAIPAITATKVRVGYLTLKTKLATAWIAGTDALAGGAGGNPASITNYYSDPAAVGVGAVTASKIGDLTGNPIST